MHVSFPVLHRMRCICILLKLFAVATICAVASELLAILEQTAGILYVVMWACLGDAFCAVVYGVAVSSFGLL